ncbi:hypothetical protein ABZZ79_27865 [Streptomyces sp. NPDC006458]
MPETRLTCLSPEAVEAARAEIAYARSLGKPVEFTHPAVDPAA